MDKIYELVGSFPDKIEGSYDLNVPKLNKDIERIAFFGMGGNYIAGLTLKELLKKEIHVEVLDNPYKFDEKTLIVLASYSGNTKEIINIFDSLRKDHTILVVCSGGKLLKKAEKSKVKILKLPPNIHQRFTFAECFFTILKTLEVSKIIKSKEKIVKKIVKTLRKEKKKLEHEAIGISIILKKENPLIYASNYFYPAAYRMQTSLEEDSKIICHSNKITELFHNELESLPESYFYPLLLLDDDELKIYKKQINFFKKHIKEYHEIKYKRYTKEERMFLFFYITDFIGYHLSRLKMTNMGETPLSDKIKQI